MKRWWLNIGLLLVLIALGLLAWLLPGADEDKATIPVTTIEAEAVTTIRIEQPDEKTAVFKRINEHWRMVEPVEIRANEAIIYNWLSAVDEKAVRSYPVKGLDLDQFGLATPEVTLTLNDQTLAFGSTAPIGYQRYIRRGDTVYLVNDSLFFQLQGDPVSFASKRLLPNHVEIVGLSLPKLELTQMTGGDWQLTPAKPDVTSDRIQGLLDAWQRAQAITVKPVSEDDKVAGKITLTLVGHDKPIRFNILANDSQLVLARPGIGIKYKMPVNARSTLLKLPQPEAGKSSNEDNNKDASRTGDKASVAPET